MYEDEVAGELRMQKKTSPSTYQSWSSVLLLAISAKYWLSSPEEENEDLYEALFGLYTGIECISQ